MLINFESVHESKPGYKVCRISNGVWSNTDMPLLNEFDCLDERCNNKKKTSVGRYKPRWLSRPSWTCTWRRQAVYDRKRQLWACSQYHWVLTMSSRRLCRITLIIAGFPYAFEMDPVREAGRPYAQTNVAVRRVYYTCVGLQYQGETFLDVMPDLW